MTFSCAKSQERRGSNRPDFRGDGDACGSGPFWLSQVWRTHHCHKLASAKSMCLTLRRSCSPGPCRQGLVVSDDPSPLVRRIDCTEANDFLDKLSPRGKLFGAKESAGSEREGDVVVFRGHSDSIFGLIPTAFRSGGPLSRLAGHSPATAAGQLFAEAHLLRRSFSLADSAGLPLPEDLQALRERISSFATRSTRIW
jgi:hypothetical protein